MFTLYIEDINGGQTHEHQFGEGELVIGRSREKCDIVLPSDNISRRHARLYTADSRCFIQDMQSSNGVFVDGVRIRDVREIETSSRVRIGDYVLYITSDEAAPAAAPVDYGRLVGTSQAGQAFTIREAVSLVGRGKDTAITVIDPSISRIHAKLTVTQGGDYVLQDLKSSNGTYVNDQRIEQTVIRSGDRLRFGNVEFQFEAPGAAAAPLDRPTASPAEIVASPAMPIPPSPRAPAPMQVVSPAHGTMSEEQTDEDIETGGGGRRWLVLGVVAGLVVALAVTLVIVLTSGKPEESAAPDEVSAEAATEPEAAAEEEERRERKERRRREQIEDELARAKELLEARSWDEAVVALDLVIDLDPTNEEVLKHRAVIAKEKPNADHVRAAKAAEERRDWAAALAGYGSVREGSLYHGEAQAAIAAIHGNRDTILQEAASAEKARDWELAERRYQEALAIQGDDADVERKLKKVERHLR
jgi:pSer/pThr/pTyr-binding forkhead associated (FHA) protein/Tfp pilus assembly protein PilF